MRSQSIGALAFVLVTLPFNASAYVTVLDFHGTSSEIYGRGAATALPAVVTDATEWDILGSIELSYDASDIDDYTVTGGSLSVNGISLGAFSDWSYSVDYYDGDGEDGRGRAQDANFSIGFNSAEYGNSYFALFSEDYSPGTNPGSNVGSYLARFPVGRYQLNEVGIGAWAADIQTSNLEFTSRPPGGQPTTPVPEPSSAPLAALGLACIIWLRRQRARM